jgi:AraC family transcriptional regulator
MKVAPENGCANRGTMTSAFPIGYCFQSTLRSREVAGLRLLESRYHPGQRSRPHVHAAASFCLVLHGGFAHTHRGETVSCEPMSLLFYRPGEPHAESFRAAGARCFIIELSSSWLARLSELDRGERRSSSLVPGPSSDLAWRAYRELREPDPFAPVIIEGLTLELLGAVLRHDVSSARGTRQSTAMDRARELIDAEVPSSISLAKVAASLGLHPVHVAHAFRRAHGCSVGQYVRRRRLERACRQLASSRASLAEIAADAGFYDQSHMTREFRRALHTTPARYRAAVTGR